MFLHWVLLSRLIKLGKASVLRKVFSLKLTFQAKWC